MSNTNCVILSGHLGSDPEYRHFTNGGGVATVSLAVKNWRPAGEATYWANLKAFGQAGEALKNYCKKGDKVTIQGSLDVDEWEKDGQKHKFEYISVRQVELPPKKESFAVPSGAPAAAMIDF